MVEKLKSVLHNEHGLRSATILLTITLFLSNVLGLVRNILLASQAKSLTQLDPYYAAFRLPDLIFNLLVLGAIASAFIPVYSELHKTKGQEEATKMANTLLGTLVIVVILAIIVLWFLMPILVPLLVAKFSLAQQLQTIQLGRIMLLSPFFFSLSYVAGAILNAHKRFFSYSIAPLIYNLSIITGALLLPQYGITAVAWAVVAGAFLHFLIQVPSLLEVGYKFRPHIDFNNPAVHKIVRLMIPRSFSLAMAQIVLLGFTAIAASLAPGALTIFSLTNDFQTTPAILFGASLATAVFPTLSDAAAEKDHAEYHHYLLRTLRVSLFVLIPLTVIVYLLRAQIIRLYIGLGHNTDWSETIRAINTLAWFSYSIVAQAIVFILARAFYALQDTKRPMYAAVIGTLVTLLLAYYLPGLPYFSGRYDVAALAAAYTIGIWVQMILLVTWLPQPWKGNWRALWASLWRILGFSILAGAATWATLRVVGEGLHINSIFTVEVHGLGTHTAIKLFIQGLSAGLVGIGSYALLARYSHLEELGWLLRLKKAPDETAEKHQG